MKRLSPLLQLEVLSSLFLAVPLFIFVLNWIQPAYAIALSIGLLLLCWKHLKDPVSRKGTYIEWKYFLLLFILAFVWVYFSGIGGYTLHNGDWKKHFALFFDLINKDWPVVHMDPSSPTGQSYLVYYMGYYLVPASIGKWLGWRFMIAFLMPYTAFGIALGFYWLRILTGHKSVLLAFLFTWAGGLDIVGWLLMKGSWPGFQEHLEWWNGVHMQYSATTNLLFWVPQQALGAWIGIPLLLNSLEKQRYEMATLCAVALPLWSPFVCVGLLPLGIWYLFKSRPQWRSLIFPSILVISFAFIFYAFFSQSMTNMTTIQALNRLQLPVHIKGFVLHHLLEYILFLAIIYWCWSKEEWQKNKGLFAIILLSLMLIPLRESRLWNDWAMRVSIPALFIVWVWLLKAMFDHGRRSIQYTVIGFLIVVASVTAFKEYERSLDWWSPVSRDLYPVRSMTHEFFDPTYKTQYFSNGDDFFHRQLSSHNGR